MDQEEFARKTISLYRYYYLDDPQGFRDQLYEAWSALGVLGRIYVAREGINAQMSVPEPQWNQFEAGLRSWDLFANIPIKFALEDGGKSFFKLTIKVRPKLVADGLDESEYDVTNVGKHLNAFEFHDLVGQDQVLVVDMRNQYESEIGHFEGAICPEAHTFREEIRMLEDLIRGEKEKKILLYCTGGIRCEKASAYLRQKGYMDVNQLHGGVIEYAQQIKKAGMASKFQGKNFVFDQRLGERISEAIISNCHQCGSPCDRHTNCANDACHLLFIQCDDCAEKYLACCTLVCKETLSIKLQGQNAGAGKLLA